MIDKNNLTELQKRDNKVVWHPFTQMQLEPFTIPIKKAKDAVLYGEDGKSYIDANASWWTNTHGHCHPYVVKAIQEQVAELDHVIFAGFTQKSAVELSEKLLTFLGDPYSKVFFSDNGSTSIEVAIKMVYQYWYNQGVQKKRMLALNGAYHGDTFGAMSVGERGYFNKPFEHLFFEVDFIELPTEENWDSIKNQVEEYFKSGDFAGFIFEPLVQGSAGMRMYDAKYLGELIALAKKYNVLTIADEVMTGNGRTGKMFAYQHTGQLPDVVCVSKGVSGGTLPIGLTVSRDDIYESFLGEEKTKALLHGHSFTGNPICCAAVNASLDLFQQDETWQKIKQIEEWSEEMRLKLEQHPQLENVRRTGTILACEIKDDTSDYWSSIRDVAYNYFIDKGVLIRPLGNTVYTNPPYAITKEEFLKVWDVVFDFLDTLK